jgi:hypothetical protein
MKTPEEYSPALPNLTQARSIKAYIVKNKRYINLNLVFGQNSN